jgi:hypothetical protein
VVQDDGLKENRPVRETPVSDLWTNETRRHRQDHAIR